MQLCQVTTRPLAEKILAHGFTDEEGTRLAAHRRKGVRLTDLPVNSTEHDHDERALLIVDLQLSEADIAAYEWRDDAFEGLCRIWLIPARFVNKHASVHLASELEESLLDEEVWSRRNRTAMDIEARALAQAREQDQPAFVFSLFSQVALTIFVVAGTIILAPESVEEVCQRLWINERNWLTFIVVAWLVGCEIVGAVMWFSRRRRSKTARGFPVDKPK